ncbi:MAG: CvpA family protein [Firmicutes bacterium]|nr:CvpA family protein [Bacillota bacterium]MBQ6663104.1 CvpA family protein [Bacillota bacterium]
MDFLSNGLTASAVFDIGIIFVILVNAAMGWSKGFVASVLNFVRWIACFAVALFAAAPVRNWLMDHTGIGASIQAHVADAVEKVFGTNNYIALLPEQIRHSIAGSATNTAEEIAAALVNLMSIIIAFLVILFVLLLITKLLIKLLENKDDDSVVGFINGFFGAIFGGIKGLLVVSLIMLLVFPYLNYIAPGSTSTIVTGIRESMLAQFLYDHNPISMILDAFA